MRTIKKILIHKKTGKKYPLKTLDDSFYTEYGTISSDDLNSTKTIIESNKKHLFLSIKPTFTDLWESLKRGPQIITQKDIGLILAKTGINHTSKVVDAGGGSGSLSFTLANICKEVTTYEINPEHYKILHKNKELLDLKNIDLKQDNIYEGIKEKNLDLITLDLPEPWQVTLHAEKALKDGAYLVVYLPNINQVKLFIDSTISTKIQVLETVELLERKWKIEGQIMRPEFSMLGHTAFLTFCRKI